jgi:hypothetical protein
MSNELTKILQQEINPKASELLQTNDKLPYSVRTFAGRFIAPLKLPLKYIWNISAIKSVGTTFAFFLLSSKLSASNFAIFIFNNGKLKFKSVGVLSKTVIINEIEKAKN